MTLSELMQRYAPNPNFSGIVTNDDNVLAVDISATQDSDIADYVVVQMGIIGVDSNMNPITQDSQYIRTGLVTTKTGNQRTFSLTGDRFIGDPFQDYIFDPNVKYGVGEIVKMKYVYFSLLNGEGEYGQVSVIVNSDGSGNAGATAGIDVSLNSTTAPQDYVYVAPGTLGTLRVASTAGLTTGTSIVTCSPALLPGLKAVYQSAASVPIPAYDDPLTGGTWNPFQSGGSYTLTDGNEIVVAYVTETGDLARYAGKATVVSAP